MNMCIASVVTFLSLFYLCEGISIYGSSPKKDDQKCGTYSTRSGRIVGGVDSFEGEFPWMISLKTASGHFCGGFVVSERHVLSAAHCFLQVHAESSGLKFDDTGKVIVSSFNATIGEFALKTPEKVPDIPVPISKLVVHPEYNVRTKSNDIAVIELSETISIHSNVEPVCLPTTKISFLWNKKATAAGWGKFYPGQSKETWESEVDKLQTVEVSIQDTGKCRRDYSSKENFSIPSIGVICAWKQDKDSCAGDSGGPLMILKDKKWIAIGVISFGKRCGDLGLPSVYTEISHYREWIDEQIR